jgi:hypothetical protein
MTIQPTLRDVEYGERKRISGWGRVLKFSRNFFKVRILGRKNFARSQVPKTLRVQLLNSCIFLKSELLSGFMAVLQ